VIEGLDIVVTHPDPTGASTFAANVPVMRPVVARSELTVGS
jgi:hypothetical protein